MARSGWVAGEIIASESDPGRGKWLTVFGSYYGSPEFHESAELAAGSAKRGDSVAYVTEVYHGGVSGGRAYRIKPGTLTAR